MTRSDWCAIAEAIGTIRDRVDASWPPKDTTHALVAHDRKLIRGAKLAAIDEISTTLAALLKRRASRFDAERFLSMTGTARRGRRR